MARKHDFRPLSSRTQQQRQPLPISVPDPYTVVSKKQTFLNIQRCSWNSVHTLFWTQEGQKTQVYTTLATRSSSTSPYKNSVPDPYTVVAKKETFATLHRFGHNSVKSFLATRNGQKSQLAIVQFESPGRGVGRSWMYCNTRPTRGEGGASPWHFAEVQKSV